MTVAHALFSDSQAKVFPWLFGQPERAYHLSELRRLSGLGSASLQRELNRLEDGELVLSQRVGNLRRFQANPGSPVYAELVAITRKTLGVVPLLREALSPLSDRLTQAYVYGSVARQSDAAGSDVDLMLVGNDLVLGDVLEQVLPLEQSLGRKINPTTYTSAQYAKRLAEPDSFVNRVLAQPTLDLMPLRPREPTP
jgi:predicted nucleotidyltransferase